MYLIPPDGSGGKVSFTDGTDGIQMAILQMARRHLYNPVYRQGQLNATAKKIMNNKIKSIS
jgi:hypothetical protein